MRFQLTVAPLSALLLSALLLSGGTGCGHEQADMSKTNRLNPDTSTGNSQQATEPPTNPNGSPQPNGSPMQP